MHAKKRPLRKFLSFLLTITVAQLGFYGAGLIPATATGAGTGTLTIVASGGAAVGTGWTNNSGVVTLTSSPVSINASDISALWNDGPVTIDVERMTINAGLTTTTANPLYLKAVKHIRIPAGVSISGQGGSVALHSNSSNSGSGQIWLGSMAAGGGGISTSGGDIILGGGTNLATGFAMASDTVGEFEASKVYAGIAMYGYALNAGGGDITLRGSGSVNLNARAILIEQNTGATRSSLQTSGTGEISIEGDGSTLSFNSNRWGPTFSGVNINTGSGDVRITGKSSTGAPNARGVIFSNMTVTSTSGNVFIEDTTNGASANYEGIYVGGATSTLSAGGNIVIKADEYISDGTLKLVGPSAVLEPYTGNSFNESRNLGLIDATECADFRFGKPGNTTELKVNQPIVFGSGSLQSNAYFYGGKVTFTGAITSSNNVIISATDAVTQTAKIVAEGLQLIGAGPFTLNNADNNVATIAGGSSGSRVGATSFTDKADGLTIGTVGSASGLFSSGVIDISTTIGDFTISQPVDSSATAQDSIRLYADRDAAAGSIGSGDIILSGAGSVVVDPTSRALLYSGTRSQSTGLVAEVGGESNARSEFATTPASLSSITVASTGKFAIFRSSASVFRVDYDANSASSGTPPSFTSASGPQTVPGNSGNLARTGFTFGGWNTQADGLGTTYAPGATINPTSNSILYAIWTANSPPSANSEPSFEPLIAAKVESVQVLPGKSKGRSVIRVNLADVPASSTQVTVIVRLLDFKGNLLQVVTVPVIQGVGTVEVDKDLSLGAFNANATAITSTSTSKTVSALPSIVQKRKYVISTNRNVPVLSGKPSGTVVFFAADSARLTPKAKAGLVKLADRLKASNSRVALTGFTSGWAKGTSVEMRLAIKRSLKAARFLKAQGVDNWIYFSGFGSLSTARSYSEARKVELRILD